VFADRFGVADERAFYYPFTGLLRAFSQEESPSLVWAAWGRQLRNEGRAVITYGNVGMVGYFSGPNVYLVDPAGLTDAFLARLPPRAVPNWRAGHWVREIPAGYLESRSQGGNRLAEPMLARLYDQVQTLTEGDLFSWARLRLAWWFLGGTPIEIDRQALRYPVSKQVLYEELIKPGKHELVFEKPGLAVVLPGLQRARKIEISVENNDIYWLVFFRDRQMVHGVVLPPEVRLAPGAILSWPKESKAGLRRFILSIPAEVDREGFDELRIMVLAGDLEHRVGGLRLVP
jgi:arabinofuranosyltransferase